MSVATRPLSRCCRVVRNCGYSCDSSKLVRRAHQCGSRMCNTRIVGETAGPSSAHAGTLKPNARQMAQAHAGHRMLRTGRLRLQYTQSVRKSNSGTSFKGPLGAGAVGGAGVVGGAVGTMVGVGGGIITIPILREFTSVPQRMLSATSLVAVASTAVVSGTAFVANDKADLVRASTITLASLVFSRIGARAAHTMPERGLRAALGAAMMLSVPAVVSKMAAGESEVDERNNQRTAPGRQETNCVPKSISEFVQQFQSIPMHELSIMACIGSIAGFASGLLGVGGGVVVTPALAAISDLPQSHVLGTSMVAMVLPSLVGVFEHSKLGNVMWRQAGILSLGSVAGAVIGSKLAIYADENALRAVFAVVMSLLGARTLKQVISTGKAAAGKPPKLK